MFAWRLRVRTQGVDAGAEVGEHKRVQVGGQEPVSCQRSRGTMIGGEVFGKKESGKKERHEIRWERRGSWGEGRSHCWKFVANRGESTSTYSNLQ